MGVDRIDNILMILGVSRKMSELEKEIVTREMIRGFNDASIEAQTMVTGGQSVQNPWPVIGGVANVIVHKDEIIMPSGGKPGDKLILTKPIGTQLAVNLMQWLVEKRQENLNAVSSVIDEDEIDEAFSIAEKSMCRLNRNSAALMKKYQAHGATDVTGFGLLGHARNLAHAQKESVTLNIHTLPIIKKIRAVNEVKNFKLMQGLSAETSGGILMMMDPSAVQDF